MSSKYRLGTRKSQLALVQANWVARELQKFAIQAQIVRLSSRGDRELSEALYDIDASHQGLFTKELEHMLLKSRVDFVVHSLKDLPTIQPEGLTVIAIPRRADSADVLISQPGFSPIAGWPLPSGACVGTSSLRREAQLLHHRPDLKIVPIRGNVPTRIDKVRRGEVNAVVLAAAGIDRLGLDLAPLVITRLDFVGAPGQGALAIETRVDAPEPLKMALRSLDDDMTRLEVELERKVLRCLEGGCTLPLGVRVVAERPLRIRAFLGVAAEKQDGARSWKSFETFDISSTDGETLVSQTVDYFKGYLALWKSKF